MTLFRYNAIDQSEQTVSGERMAETAQQLREQLEAEGFHNIQVSQMDSPDPPGKDSAAAVVFDEKNLEDFGETFASITSAGLPLEAGLKLMAEEHPSARVSAALVKLSERLESGETWESITQESASTLPSSFGRLFQLPVSPGQFSSVLSRYLSVTHDAKSTRRKIWGGLMYSIMILCTLVFTLGFFLWYLIPGFKDIFIGFDTELPGMTVTLIDLSDFARLYGVWILGAVLVAVLFLALGGGRRMRRFVQSWGYALPFSGYSFKANELSVFCRLLAELVDQDVPLELALEVSAGGSRDLMLQHDCIQVARDVQQGASLSEAARSTLSIPQSLLMTFHWSNQRDEFAKSLRAQGDSYQSQAQSGAVLLPVVMEPFLLLMTMFTVGIIVTSLFMPLIKLLNDLS